MIEQMKPADIENIGHVSRVERKQILTPEALAFVAGLERQFGARRRSLLREREEKRLRIHSGELPDFLRENEWIRNGDWSVTHMPADRQQRRAEITGPAGDRKMVVSALNSGAYVYMADFENANSPAWDNTIDGQINLRDAVNGTIRFVDPDGKAYSLNPKVAILMVRPRGWHLEEKHMLVDGKPVSGALFDFGLFLFHNAHTLIRKGSGPYFYLPKLESHREAELWNDVFIYAQNELGLPQGTIQAAVHIEMIAVACSSRF